MKIKVSTGNSMQKVNYQQAAIENKYQTHYYHMKIKVSTGNSMQKVLART